MSSIPEHTLRGLIGPVTRKPQTAQVAAERALTAHDNREAEANRKREERLQAFYNAPRCRCGEVLTLAPSEDGDGERFACTSCGSRGRCTPGVWAQRVYEYEATR